MSNSKVINQAYANRTITIKYGVGERTYRFATFKELKSTIHNENVYWEKIDRTNRFIEDQKSIYNVIEGKINEILQSDNENAIESILNSIQTTINNFKLILQSDSYEADFIKSLNGINEGEINNIYNFVVRENNGNPLGIFKKETRSVILGLYFSFTLDSMRFGHPNDRENDKKTALLNEYIEEYNAKIELLDNKIDKLLKEKEDKLNNLFEEEQKKYESEYSDLCNKTDNLLNLENKNLKNLEELYEEKLTLSAPTKYWEALKNRYIKSGKIWILISITTAIIISIICYLFIIMFPEIYSPKSVDKLSNILKWMIVTGVGLSVLIYLLRLFVKLATSAFHMSRDAEERRVLSYLYLSLLKKEAIDKDQSSIVFNALFSRVDTGLLKGDSSPTIPNGALTDIIKLMKL